MPYRMSCKYSVMGLFVFTCLLIICVLTLLIIYKKYKSPRNTFPFSDKSQIQQQIQYSNSRLVKEKKDQLKSNNITINRSTLLFHGKQIVRWIDLHFVLQNSKITLSRYEVEGLSDNK